MILNFLGQPEQDMCIYRTDSSNYTQNDIIALKGAVMSDDIWVKNGKSRTQGYKINCKDCGKEIIIRKCQILQHGGSCKQCAVKKTHDKNRIFEKEHCKEYHVHKARRKQLIRMKNNKCFQCGAENLPIYCYEFHHRDPQTKSFDICKGYRSWKETLIEIEKCDMLCLFCHRTLHRGDERLENNPLAKES